MVDIGMFVMLLSEICNDFFYQQAGLFAIYQFGSGPFIHYLDDTSDFRGDAATAFKDAD